MARGSDECRLPLIALPDSNEVVRATQVQLREDAGPRSSSSAAGTRGSG